MGEETEVQRGYLFAQGYIGDLAGTAAYLYSIYLKWSKENQRLFILHVPAGMSKF